MAQFKTIFCGIIFLLLLSGCVTITDKAMSVQVHKQVSSLLDDCKRIGPVRATGTSMMSAGDAVTDAKIKLRENAADQGGDTVAVLNTDVITNFTNWEAHANGIVFKCY